MNTVSAAFACVCLLTFAGCSGSSSQNNYNASTGVSTASTSADSGTSSADGTADGTAGDSSGDSATTSPKFDTPDEGTGQADDGGGEMGCHAIDFLFVIDNSGSMGDNQTNLITSFPGFVSAIEDTVEDANGDFHIMVTRTDALWGGECPFLCQGFGFCPSNPNYDCMMGTPDPCYDTMGSGVTYPLGGDSSNMECNLTGGNRYITSQEQDLATKFQCIAKLGTSGDSDERPAEAMTAALSDALNDPGQCNEGFLRDDAILVVTVITDEEDTSSPGEPPGWYANLVAAKKGDASGIVMLGLINDLDQQNPVCPPESQDAVRLRTFIDMFENGFRGSVCELDYGQFFEEAVSIIDTTCDDYIPPG